MHKDGTTKLFLSTKGEANDVSKPLKNFLDYVDGCAPADELMQEIDGEVTTAKQRDEWRREYMTLALEIEKEKKAAKAEGALQIAIASVRNIVNKKNMSAREAIDLLGYDEELSAKLLLLLV